MQRGFKMPRAFSSTEYLVYKQAQLGKQLEYVNLPDLDLWHR